MHRTCALKDTAVSQFLLCENQIIIKSSFDQVEVLVPGFKQLVLIKKRIKLKHSSNREVVSITVYLSPYDSLI